MLNQLILKFSQANEFIAETEAMLPLIDFRRVHHTIEVIQDKQQFAEIGHGTLVYTYTRPIAPKSETRLLVTLRVYLGNWIKGIPEEEAKIDDNAAKVRAIVEPELKKMQLELVGGLLQAKGEQ